MKPRCQSSLNVIPVITDPLGKHWDQPSRADIAINDDYAYMSKSSIDKLKCYNNSMPIGKYEGKMWKSSGVLFWYHSNINPNLISIASRKIVLVHYV